MGPTDENDVLRAALYGLSALADSGDRAALAELEERLEQRRLGQRRSELEEALELTARVAAEATGCTVRLYPLSARAALTPAGDPGFTAFAADFADYLESGRASDLRLSVAGHAERLAADGNASAPRPSSHRPRLQRLTSDTR